MVTIEEQIDAVRESCLRISRVHRWVDELCMRYSRTWWETPTEFPVWQRVQDAQRRKAREARLDAIIDQFCSKLESFPERAGDQPQWYTEANALIREAGREVFGIEDPNLSHTIFGGFLQATHVFIKEATAFDAGIHMVDIMQAMRNVWIMNCLQVLLGQKVEYTPAIFGYSMLYPVTDNTMDNARLPSGTKMHISCSFRCKLSGQPVEPASEYEASIFRLVEAIESQYERAAFPQVYDSLLSIHRAQERSIGQQGKQLSPYESDILGISVEKGGTSVLADAFLVAGDVSFAAADFIFGFGVILQLMDDLQDAMKDRETGHMTLFSLTAGQWQLDSLANRLLHLLKSHMEGSSFYSAPETHEMICLIQNNCILLVMEAISRNRRLFSRRYIRRIEAYSPYSFTYLKALGKRLQKKYEKLSKKAGGRSLDQLLAAAAASDIAL